MLVYTVHMKSSNTRRGTERKEKKKKKNEYRLVHTPLLSSLPRRAAWYKGGGGGEERKVRSYKLEKKQYSMIFFYISFRLRPHHQRYLLPKETLHLLPELSS